MLVHLWVFLSAGGLFLTGAAIAWTVVLLCRKNRFARACRDFHRQRERLEAKFVQLGLINTKSHLPRWTDCEFEDDVAYARSRSTGELSAFVAVTIEMEGFDTGLIRGGDLVGHLRAATAVFRFDGHHWETDGRAIFNLSPTEAIHFYQRDLEMMGREVAARP
jgi:hypothetical protein